MTGFLFLIASGALLAGGAELFAEHAAAAGRRLGVTALAIGVVLAGAEPEEMFTAVIATLHHRPGIAVGDAIGANLTMLTLVLGLASLARPLPFGTRLRIYAYAAAGAGAAAAVAVLGAGVTRPEGTVLVLAYLALLVFVWRREHRPPVFGEAAEIADEREPENDEAPALSLLLVLAGLVAMTVGGRFAVAGAERVVAALHLTDTAVGLTLVALATTAELFALVRASARRGVPELALAGVLGSAVYNSTATLGVAALVRPLRVEGVAIPATLATVLPLALLALSRSGRISRATGVGLLVVYTLFVVLALR